MQRIARMIDHALLHPAMSAMEAAAGCAFARNNRLGAVCVKSVDVAAIRPLLSGTEVALCAVVGFPHGNTVPAVKAMEAAWAIGDGAVEIDMVLNIGRVSAKEWAAVDDEIRAVNEVCLQNGSVLKVIFETHLISDAAIIKLCEICTDVGVGYVKTCTGFGYIKQADGQMAVPGATEGHIRLMRSHAGARVQIKASGGIRTLDDVLRVYACGATRFGTSAAAAILDEARKRGLDQPEAEWPEVSGHTHLESMAY